MNAIGKFLAIGGAVVAAGAAFPIVIGFGTAGIAAGSIAAGIQSAIGNIAAGSLFASMTSVGMTGGFATAAAGGAVTSAIGTVMTQANRDQNDQNRYNIHVNKN